MEVWRGEGCTDPIDAVLQQDRAFGVQATDHDLWFASVHFPLAMVASTWSRVLPSREEADRELELMDRASRAQGVAALCTEIRTHLQPSPDLAIVCAVRERLDAQGNRLAGVSMTFVLMREGDIWRIRTIHFDDLQYDESMTTLVTRQQGDKQ